MYKVCTVGGNTVERGYSSEVEVVADLAGLLSDGQTDGLVCCKDGVTRRKCTELLGTSNFTVCRR